MLHNNLTQLQSILAAMIAGSSWPTTIHLFQNNFAVGVNPALASFTESTFPGYASQTITGLWTAVGIISPLVYSQTSLITWTLTAGSQSVYGYYVTDSTPNLYWAENDPAAPVTLSVGSPNYSVQLYYSLEDQ
jgi:hypothetical protein